MLVRCVVGYPSKNLFDVFVKLTLRLWFWNGTITEAEYRFHHLMWGACFVYMICQHWCCLWPPAVVVFTSSLHPSSSFSCPLPGGSLWETHICIRSGHPPPLHYVAEVGLSTWIQWTSGGDLVSSLTFTVEFWNSLKRNYDCFMISCVARLVRMRNPTEVTVSYIWRCYG